MCSPSSRSAALLYLAPLMLHPAFAKSQAARLSEYWARQYEEFFVRKTLTRRSRLAKAAGEAEAAAAEPGTASGGTTSMRPVLRSTDAAAATAPSAGRVLQQMFGGMFGKRCPMFKCSPRFLPCYYEVSSAPLLGNQQQSPVMDQRRRVHFSIHILHRSLPAEFAAGVITQPGVWLMSCVHLSAHCCTFDTTTEPTRALLQGRRPGYAARRTELKPFQITKLSTLLLQSQRTGGADRTASLGAAGAADSGRRRGIQPTPGRCRRATASTALEAPCRSAHLHR